MSSFIVSPATMQRCVTALQRCVTALHPAYERRAQADELGRALFKLNAEAAAYRYGKCEEFPEESDWTWRVDLPIIDSDDRILNRATVCDCLKALHCLRYQCNEGDEVPATILYRQIERRIHELERLLATSLPEYKAAPWDSQVTATA